MKELPYFKFFPGEWMKGDIVVCSQKAQGLFINICAYYWSKECNINLTQVQRRFNDCLTELKELIDDEIISVDEDKIYIDFLDDQFSEFAEIRKQQSLAGKASAKKRKANARSTDVQRTSNHKDKIREDKNKEEYKEFIRMFNNLTNRDFKGTDKSKSQLNARMDEGFTMDDIRKAITNCSNDEFHKQNTKYLTPEFITRSDKLQQYLNIQKQYRPDGEKIKTYD